MSQDSTEDAETSMDAVLADSGSRPKPSQVSPEGGGGPTMRRRVVTQRASEIAIDDMEQRRSALRALGQQRWK